MSGLLRTRRSRIRLVWAMVAVGWVTLWVAAAVASGEPMLLTPAISLAGAGVIWYVSGRLERWVARGEDE